MSLRDTMDAELGNGYKPSSLLQRIQQNFAARRARVLGIAAATVASILLLWLLGSYYGTVTSWSSSSSSSETASSDASTTEIDDSLAALSSPYDTKVSDPVTFAGRQDETLHVVLPASNRDVNVCKLLLGCSLLGYPTPTLLAWEEDYDQAGILGGGSHMAKVSRVLEYLQALDSSQDDELVLMLDAYDIQLQLPKSTLIDRYHQTSEAAQKRFTDFAGSETVEKGNVHHSVLFGAGKRCAPNQPHMVACYAIPDSPVPMDLYGSNTDTVVGHNHYYSVRQRFLNSGFIMGPAKAMRSVFAEAWRLIQEHPDLEPLDDGSHGSDFMYHGSDQSIFADMYGKQEFAREKRRLRHAPAGTQPRNSSVFFSYIDNVLNPSFYHEPFDVDLDGDEYDNDHEYGIYLDFWSDMAHQTINSEVDALWLRYNGEVSLEDQVGFRMWHFDCPTRAPDALPEDITLASVPTDDDDRSLSAEEIASDWRSRPLYTHLCMGRIPVLRHMNGVKEHREEHWPLIWYQPEARAMLRKLEDMMNSTTTKKKTFEEHRASPSLSIAGGAFTDKGARLTWGEICPSEYDQEIFRDV